MLNTYGVPIGVVAMMVLESFNSYGVDERDVSKPDGITRSWT